MTAALSWISVSRCNDFFIPLFKALKERVSRYNKRHPQEFGFPNAVLIDDGFSSSNLALDIRTTIEPKSSLTLDFPINSGAMQIKVVSQAGEFDHSIGLDVVDSTPKYYWNRNEDSADAVAELLFERFLSPTEFSEGGKKFGFV